MDEGNKKLVEIWEQLKKFKETNEWIRRNQSLLYLSDKIKELIKKDKTGEFDWVVIRILAGFLEQLDKEDSRIIQDKLLYQGLKAFYQNGDLFNYFRDMEQKRKQNEGEEE